jgi:two-component system, sensor histidine kinase and response regulator
MNTVTRSDGSSLEILIAEDSRTQALRLEHILQQQGYEVTVAANGRIALDAARQRKPALVISDVVMPEMDGYDLCRSIKSDPVLSSVPVILITTMSDPADVIRGLECRADNFILKPYDERYLLNRLQFVLVNHEMQRNEQPGMGLEIFFNGQRHFITADRLQILNLLLSTYDAAIQRNKELSSTQGQLRQANAELAMANRELESANKELEAFSYSVSHDLRAPLRHIDGFSQLLADDHNAELTPPGQRLLLKVRDGARRMGVLIDELLNFSRLSRQPLNTTTVSVSELVKDVLAELDPELSGRKVDIRIGDLPDCRGDRGLLRQVFANLLSNALKFSRHREHALVEVGCERHAGELVYSVRDNGAGFDMQYASQLFGVFQRLHSAEQFEGTGVGLSIVQRIIHRHGGRIWVEAEVDKGAHFHLTLPPALAA